MKAFRNTSWWITCLAVWTTVLVALPAFAQYGAQAGVRGIVVSSPFPGAESRAEEFSDIDFRSAQMATVRLMNGTSKDVQNSSVTTILYFYGDDVRKLDARKDITVFRNYYRGKEVVFDVDPQTVDSDTDASALAKGVQGLSNASRDYPAAAKTISPMARKMQETLARYQAGEHRINGAWMPAAAAASLKKENELKDSAKAAEDLRNSTVTTNGERPVTRVSFTTKDGHPYMNAAVTAVNERGVGIEYSAGAATVKFRQLPDDLTVFPADVQKQIKYYASRAAAPPPAPAPAPGN